MSCNGPRTSTFATLQLRCGSVAGGQPSMIIISSTCMVGWTLPRERHAVEVRTTFHVDGHGVQLAEIITKKKRVHTCDHKSICHLNRRGTDSVHSSSVPPSRHACMDES
jgi:hypothetical protein